MTKQRVLQKSISLYFILSLIVLCTFVQAQNIAKVDSLFAKWDKPDTPGAAVAIIKDGEFVIRRGYGMANLDYNIPITDQSIFRIASASKRFTAACIILLKEKGKLNLDDSLSSFFPDFPDYAKKITVRHLLHHTSGIRDYLTLAFLSGYTDDDHYTDNDVMIWLKNQKETNFKPGSEFLYSNSGYWLLGQIVKEVSGQSMADFAQKELFEPLGMKETHFHNDHRQVVENRATGYQPKNDSTFQISTTTLDMIGDGGIFTSINDMKKWSDAFHESDVLQKSFWDAMTEKGKLNNGESINYAAGLGVGSYKGLKTIYHGGAFVGYRAQFMRFPEQHFSIVILSNRSDADPLALSYKMADLYLKEHFNKSEDAAKQTTLADRPNTKPKDLSNLTGQYAMEPGIIVEIRIDDDSLNVLQKWNDSSYNVSRLYGNTFVMPTDSTIKILFSEFKNGSADSLIVMQADFKTPGERIPDLKNIDIDLESYVGQYFSEELNVTYTLFKKENQLSMRIGVNEPSNLNPMGPDRFQSSGRFYRFMRNDKGQISGFRLDAGRVKNLKFLKE